LSHCTFFRYFRRVAAKLAVFSPIMHIAFPYRHLDARKKTDAGQPSNPRPNRIALRLLAGLATSLTAASCSAQSGPPMPMDVVPVDGPLAFPGAVGYGAGAVGGRNGRIIFVDSLSDSGEGTLRACIDASGPRVCVFRVGGVIRFVRRPPIIRNPYITIAGQTAPGGGITLAHSGGPDGVTPLLIKNTHDVVVRHIRVRLDRIGEFREAEDAFTIENSDNVILDHVSGSWARDEVVNGYGDNDRITISWSIFAEGIPRHDKCALLGGDPHGPQRLSFIGNLCAHNGDRNPDVNFEPGSCVEVLNNVLYNAQSQFAEIWESYGGSPVSIVGNVMRAGHNTGRQAVGIDLERIGSTGSARIFHWDNQFDGRFQHRSPLLAGVNAAEPPCPLTILPLRASETEAAVLSRAGAFPRDAFDRRIVADVRNRTGRIVHVPGPMPPVASGRPYPDEDRDGMDDGWERAHGADPSASDPWGDADGDGLANLDAFLDAMHRRLVGDEGQ
jgi:hypothetical protein